VAFCLLVPKLLLSSLYTSVRGPSFRHGLPESSHKDVNLGAGNLPESSTCASGKLPSLGSGFRHPCRNDGVFGSAGLVYNDEISCLGTPGLQALACHDSGAGASKNAFPSGSLTAIKLTKHRRSGMDRRNPGSRNGAGLGASLQSGYRRSMPV